MTNEEAKKCLETIDIQAFRDTTESYYFKDINEAKNIAIEALSQPKWIPVTEELPKIDQYVLALVNPAIEREHPIIISSRDKGNEKYWTDGTIIAWMPLPPFKGVEK